LGVFLSIFFIWRFNPIFVYREIFQQIAAEDEDEGRDDEIPAFGDSASSYEDVIFLKLIA